MRFTYLHEVPAPLERVRHVLSAKAEYPIWCSAAYGAPNGMRWRMPLVNGGVKQLHATSTTESNAARLTLRLGPLVRVDHQIDLVSADAAQTHMHVAISTSGAVALAARRFALSDNIRCFCYELSARAFWLPRARDTNLLPDLSSRPLSAEGPRASLEQLSNLTRELEGGILAIDTCTSSCLVDLRQQRFLRAEHGSDLNQLIAFAKWEQFERILIDGKDVVIEPTYGSTPIRIRARRRDFGATPSPRP